MRAILSVVVVAVCLLTGCADIDGVVEAADVCRASHDVAEQPDFYRPDGGTMSVSAQLEPERIEAVLKATDIRREATGGQAVWAVTVGGPERLEVGDDGVLLATCQPGDLDIADRLERGAWAYTKPTAGVGIIWQRLAPEGWAYVIAAQLAVLEGRGEAIER